MSKNIVKWFLLFFVIVTIIVQISKSFRTAEQTFFADGKHLVFFHAKVRCPTCTAMERLVKQTLEDNFKDKIQSGALGFRILDYESVESKRIVEKYKIATATVLLFEQKEGQYIQGQNLAQWCWKLVGNESEFKKMLKTQIEDFVQGNISQQENKTEEMELVPDLNLFEEVENNTTKEKNNENDQ